MKRVSTALLAAAQLICLLCACGGASAPAAGASQGVPEKTPVAFCMGAVNHPVRRIAQLGFLEAADELGYAGHIVGLEEICIQELYGCWEQSAEAYPIAGAVCWVDEASAYESLKRLHGMGVKIVAVPYRCEYMDTNHIFGANVCLGDESETAVLVAEYIAGNLKGMNVESGSIGISYSGSTDIYHPPYAFREYMEAQYPEYRVLGPVWDATPSVAKDEAVQKIESNPDMAAAFGMRGGGARAWAEAKSITGRSDIFIVGYESSKDHLDLLTAGEIDMLVSRPIYKTGYVGMTRLDELLNGKELNISEAKWRTTLDMEFVYPGGAGVHDPAYYYDQYTRAEERFSQ